MATSETPSTTSQPAARAAISEPDRRGGAGEAAEACVRPAAEARRDQPARRRGGAPAARRGVRCRLARRCGQLANPEVAGGGGDRDAAEQGDVGDRLLELAGALDAAIEGVELAARRCAASGGVVLER